MTHTGAADQRDGDRLPIVSIASFAVCPFIAVVGVVLGYQARAQIRECHEDGDGLTFAGIITGWVGLGYAVLVAALFAFFFTIPHWAPVD